MVIYRRFADFKVNNVQKPGLLHPESGQHPHRLGDLQISRQ